MRKRTGTARRAVQTPKGPCFVPVKDPYQVGHGLYTSIPNVNVSIKGKSDKTIMYSSKHVYSYYNVSKIL